MSKKRGNGAVKSNPAKGKATSTVEPGAKAVSNYESTPSELLPDPESLFHEAEQEPDFRTLRSYVDSIRVLRKKSFSYRDIADWLSKRGIDADHNAVYRVYTNSLSDYDAHLEEQREEEEAREEAERSR